MLRLLVALAFFGALANAVTAATAPPVEAYGRLPAVEHISLSPSGQRYAFIAVIGEARKLVAVTADGLTPIYSTDVGGAEVVDVQWAGEDHLLVTIVSTVAANVGFNVTKAQFPTVVAINLQTHKSFQVFDQRREVSGAVIGRFGVAKIGDHWFGYFGGITLFGRAQDTALVTTWPDLYRVDLDNGDIRRIATGDEDVRDWLVGPGGEVIARTIAARRDSSWQVRTGAAGGRLLASGDSKVRSIGSLVRGRTPDSVVFDRTTPNGWVFQEIALSGTSAAKPPEDDNILDLLVDPASRLWVGSTMQGDQREARFFAPQAEARMQGAIKAFPGLSVHLKSFTPDLGRMIVETSGTGDSGVYWLVDITTGSADPVGYAYPSIKPADVGVIEMVDWKAADGLVLHGVLSLPTGRSPANLPVVVMPSMDPTDRQYPVFWWWAQLFASRGYAVFQPNVRGSYGYGDAFRNAGFGEMGQKMQTDISGGIDALARKGVIDPKRACIAGLGVSGYAALAGVTIQHGVYRCAISVAGLSDPEAFLAYQTDYYGQMSKSELAWAAFMGVTSSARPSFAAISPVRHAAEADAPILLIHGKADITVPIAQSQAMERALKAADKPVELLELPDADHWILREDARLAMVQASLNFVLKYNPPDPQTPQ